MRHTALARALRLAALPVLCATALPLAAQRRGGGEQPAPLPPDTTNQARRDALKAVALKSVDSMATMTQQMVETGMPEILPCPSQLNDGAAAPCGAPPV